MPIKATGGALKNAPRFGAFVYSRDLGGDGRAIGYHVHEGASCIVLVDTPTSHLRVCAALERSTDGDPLRRYSDRELWDLMTAAGSASVALVEMPLKRDGYRWRPVSQQTELAR